MYKDSDCAWGDETFIENMQSTTRSYLLATTENTGYSLDPYRTKIRTL